MPSHHRVPFRRRHGADPGGPERYRYYGRFHARRSVAVPDSRNRMMPLSVRRNTILSTGTASCWRVHYHMPDKDPFYASG